MRPGLRPAVDVLPARRPIALTGILRTNISAKLEIKTVDGGRLAIIRRVKRKSEPDDDADDDDENDDEDDDCDEYDDDGDDDEAPVGCAVVTGLIVRCHPSTVKLDVRNIGSSLALSPQYGSTTAISSSSNFNPPKSSV